MYSRYGKPLLKEYFNIFFSISHCKSGCVVAFMKLVGIGMIPDLQFLSIVIAGNLERANIFKARLLIRHAASGKNYLYDILEIKKKRASPVRHKPYPVKTHFLRRIIARIFRFVNGKGRI